MPSATLRETLQSAEQARFAVGHFNFSELVALKAVAATARDLHAPVLVGLSESERDFIGVQQAAALVKSIREESGTTLFLNADHTHSLDKAVTAAKAGFDMVVLRCFRSPLRRKPEANALRRRSAQIHQSINPEIVVEGEIGYIGTSSAIHASIPTGMSPLSTPEEAKQFVQETHVDVLAPAVGTMHGMLKSVASGQERKHLDIARIAEIKRTAGIFLTLHDGSGTHMTQLLAAIQAGITVVHINTELRVAWRKGLEDALKKHPEEIAPYHLLPAAYDAVSAVVRQWMQTFRHGSAAVA